MTSRTLLTLCLFAAQLVFTPPVVVSAAAPGLASFPVPEEKAVVYDENNNGQADLSGDTWIFDQNTDGAAELIIRFRQGVTLVAEIYDDINADRRVDYRVGEREIQILELHWRVQLTARDGTWSLPDGFPNWNLDLLADSGFYIRSARLIPTTVTCKMDTDSVAIGLRDQENIPRYGPASVDGQPDFQTRYWDVDKNGIPDYEWRNISWDGRNDVIITNLSSNLHYIAKHRFPALETLLGMDWENARLLYVNTLIPTRADEAGYFLLFRNTSALPDQINTAWESPFAFYDLHGDSDCIPELRLRAVTDISDNLRSNFIAYNEIRYSWSQDSNEVQYRLYLIGQLYSDAVWQYPVYPVAHIGYEDLPRFVLQQAWRGASFAEAEPGLHNIGFPEGFYENLGYTPALRAVVLNNIKQELPPRYLPLYLNLREEFNLTAFDRTPRLYFSAIDRRLHLLGAKEGTVLFAADTSDPEPGFDFNLKSAASGELNITAETVYMDTNDDGYIDTWNYRENDQVQQQLVVRPGAALFVNTNSIQLKKLPENITVAVWETNPPASTAEWKTLGEQLAPVQKDRRLLNDLGAIFADLPGDVNILPNTTLVSVSAQKDSFLAQMNTLGISAGSTPFLPEGLQAGDYILRVDGDSFRIESPSMMMLELTPITLSDPLQQVDGLKGILAFSVKNPGNADVFAQIKVWDEFSRRTVLFDETKTIPAIGQVDVSLPWAPAIPGVHHLIVQVQYIAQGRSEPVSLNQQLDWQIDTPDPTSATLFLFDPYLNITIVLMILLVSFVAAGAWAAIKAFENYDENSG